MKALITILIIAICLAISFFGTAGLVWVVCWVFGLSWSWKIALGVWAALCLISGAVKTTVSRK